jgi:hypothetical protein
MRQFKSKATKPIRPLLAGRSSKATLISSKKSSRLPQLCQRAEPSTLLSPDLGSILHITTSPAIHSPPALAHFIASINRTHSISVVHKRHHGFKRLNHLLICKVVSIYTHTTPKIATYGVLFSSKTCLPSETHAPASS